MALSDLDFGTLLFSSTFRIFRRFFATHHQEIKLLKERVWEAEGHLNEASAQTHTSANSNLQQH